ncbi:MAG TPA: Rieske (2Fe-2S) protein [Acidimicrobiales bacterium]|nr:Rieske (2Fe-2S) protein [Acidimicrobiales bacterium]
MRSSSQDEAFTRRVLGGWRRPTALAHRIEQAEVLDRPAGRISAAVSGPLADPSRRDALSGSWLGHPVHPALVALPLGCWSAASLMDLVGERMAARKLVAAGLLAAVPTAATGLSDWLDTAGAERRVGLVHMAANSAATVVYAASWRARRRDHHLRGAALGLLGAGLAGAGGWLGGHLSYALGVGVDTNAFDAGPSEWTPLGVEVPGGGEPVRAVVGSVPVVASRQADGVRVLAERCSHRGGPLSEGEVGDGCVTCPWHGSRFDLATGAVRQGPAVVEQPVYEVRQTPEGIQVRRDEPRALRSNSVKP